VTIVDVVIRITEKGSANLKRVSQGVKDLQDSFLKAAGMVAVFTGAAYTVNKALDATVGEFVRYAATVRQGMDITGQSAEMMSRLIQVADDYKISTNDLEMAQRNLAMKGYPMTVDALAQLSDKYLTLNTATERQTFLSENFGARVGQRFALMMTAGGDAIHSQSEAIADNLILTDKAIKQARDYEISIDDLNDTIYGLKIAVGEKAIPIVIELITRFTQGVGITSLSGAYSDLQHQMAAGAKTYDEYKAKSLAFFEGLSTAEQNVIGLTGHFYILSEAEYENAKALAEATIAAAKMGTVLSDGDKGLKDLVTDFGGLYKVVDTMQGLYDNFNEKQDELIQKQEDIQAAIDEAIQQVTVRLARS